MPNLSCVIKEQLITSVRLDLYVSENLKLLSRSQIKARNLSAKINGKDVKLSRIVKQGDCLDLLWDDFAPVNFIAQDIPLDIIYEDENCVVVNKAQGMVVHPGAGNRQGTLANALYFRRLEKGGNINPDNGNERPGIVHRLDKDTSGIIIAAYNDASHAFLAEQFKTRKTRKNYFAVVQGVPKETKGRIETFIAREEKDRRRFTVSANGRNAVTFYKVIKNWKTHSLLLLRPRTGRTHQIRVHMRYLGCPILGDSVYGSADKLFPDATLMLHSKSLAIFLPGKNDEYVFSSPLPERFNKVIDKLNRINR
ncbi:MAG: RluA family pseudouridine synthase [Treponema sp.]|nr:RluA family pseudouridine synthase [Treponema sp.]